jgi:two-component system, NtrC family, sensor histidine kinase HydH
MRIALLRGALFVFLLLSSAAILYTTAQNIRMAESLADQALESTALSLSTSAEMELRAGHGQAGDHMQQLFSDRVVAYALIAHEDGKIMFHTNPYLVGSLLAEKGLADWLKSGKASGGRIILKTGLPAFQFNYPLHRPDGRAELLRLVLHTTPADRIISRTQRMWWPVGLVLGILWTLGILVERMFIRQFRLREELDKKERMALIGQMTAVLAHEIRNALGGIKGYAQWIGEKMDPADPKKTGVGFVLKGTDRIESLVNDLLLFSRDETYTLILLEPDPLIREALDQEASFWKGQIDVSLEPGTTFRGDREKMTRALANGIQNALQSMGRDGTLRLAVRPEGRWVEIRIEDSGPGIPQEELPLLFVPFHTTKPSGTGLGLAYSKKIIEGMGGTITLSNRPEGPGACLSIRLPRAERN